MPRKKSSNKHEPPKVPVEKRERRQRAAVLSRALGLNYQKPRR
jgi:hypothetical protein